MNEATVSAETRRVLAMRGYVVQKHHDVSTSGIPDMTIVGYGKTLWVEDKFMALRFANLPFACKAKDFTDARRFPQMRNMIKLRKHNNNLAEYWLYIRTGGKTYVVTQLDPTEVMRSFKFDTPIVITEWHEVKEWRDRGFNLRNY